MDKHQLALEVLRVCLIGFLGVVVAAVGPNEEALIPLAPIVLVDAIVMVS